MNKIVLSLVAVLVILGAGVANATTPKPTVVNNYNSTTVVNEQNHNAWDYGVFADVVAFETPNSEWGLHSTYTIEGNETRVYLGGKIYLNRMTYQKKD